MGATNKLGVLVLAAGSACWSEPTGGTLCNNIAVDDAGAWHCMDEAGDAGVNGDAIDSVVVGDAGDSPLLAQAEKTCALVSACVPTIAMDECVNFRMQFLGDVSGHPLSLPSVWSQLDSATSCSQVSLVFGVALSSYCASKSDGTYCAGTSAMATCASNQTSLTYCALWGQSCAGATPVCGFSTQTTALYVECDDVTASSTVCGGVGGVCGQATGCTSSDPACTSLTPACNGTRVNWCRFGAQATFDCSTMNATCDVSNAPSAPPAGSQMCESSGACTLGGPTCLGADLHYCLLRQERDVPCTRWGLGACAGAATKAACGPN